MEAEKTVGLTFRVSPQMKRMLEIAASHEHRSLTNMFEILVVDHCRRQGLARELAETSSKEASAGESRP